MIRKPITIQDYWQILIRRKWSLLIPFVVIATISGVLAYILPNIYQSTTVIFVEPQKIPEEYVQATVTQRIEDRLNTISQQILSRTRLEKIIREFSLYKGTDRGSRFEMILARLPLLSSYWNFSALSLDEAVAQMKKDIRLSVQKNKSFTISYQGRDPEVTMQVTNKLASLFIEENLKVREQQAEGTSEFLETELENIRQVLEQKEKQVREFRQRYMGELPQQLDANLRALDRFQVEFKSISEALSSAEERKESIEKLITLGQQEIIEGDASLLARLSRLNAQLAKLQIEYKEDYPDIILLKREIKEIEGLLSRQGGSIEQGKGKNGTQSESLFSKSINTQLQDLNREISALKSRRTDLTNQITLYEKRVENVPLREQELLTIMRDYQNIQNNYQSLLSKRLEAKISENLEKRQKGEIFRVLDPANYPVAPYKPNRWRILFMGILMALGGGVGLIFLREQMDQSFAAEEELSESVGIPVLATIPHQPLLKKQIPATKGGYPSRINYRSGQHSGLSLHKASPAFFPYMIGVQDPSSATAEQFRILHTWLKQAHETKSCKVFCFTSAVEGEGKTFTAVNLAITMSRDFGKKTLLMDVDCRGAMLEKLIRREDQPLMGWTHVVTQKASLHEALIPYNHGKLFLLPSGKVECPSSSLITSLGSFNLINELRKEFDYILMDAPPILPLADMRLLKDLVDGIILVVKAEETTRDMVVKSLNNLQRDRIIGLVLNNKKQGSKRYYYYNYYKSGAHMMKTQQKQAKPRVVE